MLASVPLTYFHEEQRFRQSWLWALIAIPIVAVMIGVASAPRGDAAAIVIAIGVCALVGLLFWLARLETTVTDDGVVVAFHGLWPTRRIRLGDIASYAPLHYSMWDSGGWGVHLGLAGMTYNVSGNEGIRFRLTNGRGVLVGTQRPADLAAAIAKAMAARGTG
jgi:hypothetical protein